MLKTTPTKKLYLLFIATLLIALALNLGVPPITRAATITVNSTADTAANDGQCTLREAISAANTDTASGAAAGECAAGFGNDTIDLTGISGTINLTGMLPNLSSNITINGPGASSLTIRRSAGGTYRIFTIDSGAAVTLSALTISNGLVVNDFGGGIYNAGVLTLNNSTVSNNRTNNDIPANGHGGGIYNTNLLTLNNSIVSDNSTNNTSRDSYGGGIYNGGTLTLNNSTVSNNDTFGDKGHGGGIHNAGTLTLNNSIVSDNSAGTPGDFGTGGGIFSAGSGSSVTLNNSTVSNNTSNSGGSGGGIWNSDGAFMELNNSTVSHNTTGDPGSFANGGGIDNTRNTTLILNNSTISNNSAGGSGGGIESNDDSTLILNNSTISNNSAGGSGGGIWNRTVTTSDSTVNIKNSIIAGNTASSGPDCDNTATFTSGGHNLMGNISSCPFTSQTGDQLNVDPLLGPLQDNGGPTETRALLDGSPAIDAIAADSCTDHQGTPVTSDQRGVARPRGTACDIGAYEFDPGGGPSTHQIYLPLVLNNPLPLVNGDFETGNLSGWSAGRGPFQGHGSGLPQNVVQFDSYNGLLGDDSFGNGAIPIGYGYIAQTFTVQERYLKMRYRVKTHDIVQGTTSDRYFDTFEGSINTPPANIDDNERNTKGCDDEAAILNPSGVLTPTNGLIFCGGYDGVTDEQGPLRDLGWKTVTLDLQNFQGNITLYFAVWSREYEPCCYNDNGYYNTWVYIDDVQLSDSP